MQYSFESGFVGAREIVMVLEEDDLRKIWSSKEEAETYNSLTIRFDIDRYMELFKISSELENKHHRFGKMGMYVQLQDIKENICGATATIFSAGCHCFNLEWTVIKTLTTYGIEEINVPWCGVEDVELWFEQKIRTMGIKSY
ncbi:TPA: hypothetical protein ACU8BU_002138 [Neisseria subflava]